MSQIQPEAPREDVGLPVPVPIVITSGDTLTRDGSGNVTVTGVNSAGATIAIYVDGQLVATVTANNSGEFSATFPLSPGTYTVRASDGKSTTTQSVTVQ